MELSKGQKIPLNENFLTFKFPTPRLKLTLRHF